MWDVFFAQECVTGGESPNVMDAEREAKSELPGNGLNFYLFLPQRPDEAIHDMGERK